MEGDISIESFDASIEELDIFKKSKRLSVITNADSTQLMLLERTKTPAATKDEALRPFNDERDLHHDYYTEHDRRKKFNE